jgi:hypothetical protein
MKKIGWAIKLFILIEYWHYMIAFMVLYTFEKYTKDLFTN